ncbi:MAG: TolC family protein [Myxococcota bacterium]
MSWRLLLLVSAVLPRAALAEPALKLSLEEALARGWTANPSLEAARGNVDRAEALVVQSRAGWLPTLSVNGSFTQLDADRKVSDRVTTAASTLNASLLLQVPLVNVARWQATGQAKDAEKIAEVDLRALERAVASLVGRAWLQVRLAQRVVEVAERALATSSDELRLAEARNAGGIGTKLDTTRSERERADNESRLALSLADLAVAQDALGALVGEHAPVDAAGDPALPAIPEHPGLELRADLQAAVARVELAQRRVDESWNDYLPTLSAILGPILQTPAYAPTPELGFQLQILLSAPLYDGGARSGLSDERLALLRQVRADRDLLWLSAEAQLRSALTQLRQRQQATAAARRSAQLAEEAFHLAEIAFSGGVSTNLELIEAQRAARDADTNAQVIANAAEIAHLDALVAMGILAPGGAR